MRKIVLSVFVSLSLLAVPVSAHAFGKTPAQSTTTPGSFADLVAPLLPAVVNISSTQKMEMPEDFPQMPQFPPGSPFEDFFEEFMNRHGNNVPSTPPASLGSGFIIDAENGYIVTNNHVIRDAEEVRVTFSDDDTVIAQVIGSDEKTDLAVLKVETKKKLTAVNFGESDSLRVGDWVVAIGNPFGLGGTVTAGIISARARNINSGPYDDFLQTDASINRGNSGGPMFDIKGNVIGINTAIFSPSGGSVGIGFAIPSSLAKPVIDQIIQFGHTRRGWLGVRIQDVTPDIAESFGLTKNEGALVATLNEGGPAEQAGLKVGDIILSFNGKTINAVRSLPRIVAETPIDAEVDVVFWRDGKEQKTKVKVGELEKAEEQGMVPSLEGEMPGPADVEIASVGLNLNTLTDEIRSGYNIPMDVQGVFIAGITPGSEAEAKGLLEGDVVVEINQQAVTEPQKVAEVIEKAQAAGRNSVLLLVNREGDMRFVALKIGKTEEPAPAKPE